MRLQSQQQEKNKLRATRERTNCVCLFCMSVFRFSFLLLTGYRNRIYNKLQNLQQHIRIGCPCTFSNHLCKRWFKYKQNKLSEDTRPLVQRESVPKACKMDRMREVEPLGPETKWSTLLVKRIPTIMLDSTAYERARIYPFYWSCHPVAFLLTILFSPY